MFLCFLCLLLVFVAFVSVLLVFFLFCCWIVFGVGSWFALVVVFFVLFFSLLSFL